MRRFLALVAALIVSSIGAVILGEYEFTGVTTIVAGMLFGLIVAEVVTGVGRQHDNLASLTSAVPAAVGIVWAAWISAGRDWDYLPNGAWIGAAVAVVAAALWVRSPGRRGVGTPRSK